MRRYGNALDHAGILNREKTFGNDDVQQHGERQRCDRDQQRGALMGQHPVQHVGVTGGNVVEKASAGEIKPALLLFGVRAQHFGAHHRRQRQRDHGGNEDGHGQCNGEFSKQAPDHIAHEQ